MPEFSLEFSSEGSKDGERGFLRKMRSQLEPIDSEPSSFLVKYEMALGDKVFPINALVGTKISLEFSGAIQCIHCQRSIKKTFQQGYCFPCMQSLARCDTCMVRPETCHFDAGTCREPKWAEEQCFIPHTLYLSQTSGVKIGITRSYQRTTRWVDQGAIQAIPVATFSSRKAVGLAESHLKKNIADKTDWRKLLKENPEPEDLNSIKDRILNDLNQQNSFTEDSASPYYMRYPVQRFPEKIKSLNFDKTSAISGQLWGIKGQYLIFDMGVINMRKFAGYEISLKAYN